MYSIEAIIIICNPTLSFRYGSEGGFINMLNGLLVLPRLGAYQQPMPPPPHVGMSYGKMVGPPTGPPASMGPYQPQSLPSQQYLPYLSRPPMGPNPYGPPSAGSYGPPHSPQQQQQQPPPNNNANSTITSVSPGPVPRPPPPHMGPPTPYPGYPTGKSSNAQRYLPCYDFLTSSYLGASSINQYGPSWGPGPNSMPVAPSGSSPMAGQPGVKGSTGVAPGLQGPPRPQHTPTHYMKQHLQHHLQQQKMYGMTSSSTPSGGAAPPLQQQPAQQGPVAQQQHLGSYSTPSMNNSGSMTSPGMAQHPPSAASPVTNIITTGPDGAGLDEASQQSTLSNTSAASGDDGVAVTPSTPRSRKETPTIAPSGHHPPFSQQHGQQQLSHPPTPQGMVPSPGATSQHSQHGEEYADVHSPGPGVGNWSISTARAAPGSPVSILHIPKLLNRKIWPILIQTHQASSIMSTLWVRNDSSCYLFWQSLDFDLAILL